MQVQAIYDHGRLVFPQPMRFVSDRFPILIELPDSAILPETNPKMTEQTAALTTHAGANLLADIQKILGPLARPRPHTSVQEDKTAYGDALEEKHGL